MRGVMLSSPSSSLVSVSVTPEGCRVGIMMDEIRVPHQGRLECH